MVARRALLLSLEQGPLHGLLRPEPAPVTTPSTNPNDAINTDNGRFVFTLWTAQDQRHLRGAVGHPASRRPLRFQQASRTAARSRPVPPTVNYGTQRILAEPIDSRRQDNIIILDTRVEKVFKLSQRTTISAFRRWLQPDQLQRRAEHHLELGGDVHDPVEYHPAAALPLRHEVRLVDGRCSADLQVRPV